MAQRTVMEINRPKDTGIERFFGVGFLQGVSHVANRYRFPVLPFSDPAGIAGYSATGHGRIQQGGAVHHFLHCAHVYIYDLFDH
jgi:hypothetical protein